MLQFVWHAKFKRSHAMKFHYCWKTSKMIGFLCQSQSSSNFPADRELVAAQDQCQSNILWIGSAPPNCSANIFSICLATVKDHYTFNKFEKNTLQKKRSGCETHCLLSFFAPVLTVTFVHVLLKQRDLFPLLAHSRAWLPPSTGSRSPAQEVHKYAPKNTNGKPPLAVESLHGLAGSVFLKPMALICSWKHWSLKKSMTNPKLQTWRSHSHSAEIDTMSSRNRRCTILSRCHLATCWISVQRNGATWSSKNYSNI